MFGAGATAGASASQPSIAESGAELAAGCRDYIVIDSRGSGEPRGLSGPGKVFYPAFRAEVLRRNPKATLTFIANGYSAWGSIPTMMSALLKLPQRYHESVKEGKVWLSNVIGALLANNKCPDTKLVLTGYSQGAQVTGDVYQNTSSKRILGVVLFGDPTSSTAPIPARVGGKSGLDGALGTRPLSSVAPGKESIGHVLSYCHDKDPVCQGVSRLRYGSTYHKDYGALGEPEAAAAYIARSVKLGAAGGALQVVSCKGLLRGGPPPKAPQTIKPGVSLPTPLKAELRFYSFSTAATLAPRGWRCSGAGGSNGDQVTAWSPDAGTHRSIRSNKPVTVPNEVVYLDVHTIGNWSVEAACEWFPDAARKYEKQWGTVCDHGLDPPGTKYETLGRGVKRVTLPPGEVLNSTTSFGGGPNPAIFQVWWVPGSRNKFGADAAQTAVCVLPARRANVCESVLADLGARFRASIGARP